MRYEIKQALFSLIAAFLVIPFASALGASDDFQRALRNGAVAQIKIRVIDDFQTPVSNVTIIAHFDAAFQSSDVKKIFKTDADGCALVMGRTGKAISLRFVKEDYYESTENICFVSLGKGVINGKWNPWGLEKTVVLRAIKNPKACKVVVEDWRISDASYEWIGFDLEKYDFVTPHGIGSVADFEIKFDFNGQTGKKYEGLAINIRFPEKYAGAYWHDRIMSSDFKDVYSADSKKIYEKAFEFHSYPKRDVKGRIIAYDRNLFDQTKCLVIRSRCVVDENGELVSARYSCITDLRFSCSGKFGSLMFQPIFNPTPNDTNLEPKR